MGFAYSKSIKGVAQFSSPAYYCAEGLYSHVENCLKSKYFDLAKIKAHISYFNEMHYIDDISNLNTSKIFLFGGLLDIEVPVEAVKFSEKVWGEYTQNIRSNYSIKSGHSMVTDFYGYKCSSV